jgi:hypothetical protein
MVRRGRDEGLSPWGESGADGKEMDGKMRL